MRIYDLQLTDIRTNRHSKCSLEIAGQLNRVVVTVNVESQVVSFDGIDFLECFERLREDLEPQGWRFLCAGARKDAFVSGMSRDMGGGETVYLFNEGMRT